MQMQFEIEPISRFDSIYDSNRLFRSLVAALAATEGKTKANELVEIAMKDKDAKISSILPMIENEVYLPSIKGLIKEPGGISYNEKRKIQKKLKKAAYYKMEDFQFLAKNAENLSVEELKKYSYLDENMNLDYFDDTKKSNIKTFIFTSQHNKVPLFNIGNTEIFYEKDMKFDKKVRFLVLVEGEEEFLKMVEKSFLYLQSFGLSHSYSAGRGQIRVKKIEKNIEIKSGLKGYLISTLHPTIEEAKKIEWENSYINYDVYQAFRWDNKYSYALPIIKAGSLIRGELAKGQVVYSGDEKEWPEKRGVYFARGFYI